VSENPIIILAGTRPEAIKVAPVIWWLDRLGVDYIFAWSGQHYDYEMSSVFFEQLQLPKPDEYLNVGVGVHDIAQQVALLIQKIVSMAKLRKFKLIYSLGDTNTTLASALASVYVTKPFVHDEAGMRSFDSSMVEEANRRAADAIANFRLAPTKIAVLNLLCEGILPSTIELVGSTVVDALIYVISHNLLREDVFNIYDVNPSQYLLFTLHRRENLTERRLPRLISILIEIAHKLPDYKVIFPIHPHTKKYIEGMGLTKTLTHTNVQLTRPLGYFEFITLLKNARLVITDSGGVQEEAFILGRRTVTLRKTTEWPETTILGYNYLIDPDIDRAADIIVKSVELEELNPPQLSTCPLGDGNAGRRVAKLLQLLTESNIERGLEVSGYPLPHLTTRADSPSLCFRNRSPVIYEELEDGYSDEICVTRENLSSEEMLKIIKVNWMKVDKLIENKKI
jgi:UDP-N-acetylglucosamine 2-epimerase (non-hydrolysing)